MHYGTHKAYTRLLWLNLLRTGYMELPYPVRLPYVKSVNIRATDTVLKSFFSKKLKGVKNNQIIAMSYSINTMSAIKIKRVYEKSEKDEYRILVDRLWPRGLTKELAAIDLWLKVKILIMLLYLRELWSQCRWPCTYTIIHITADHIYPAKQCYLMVFFRKNHGL